MIGRSIPRATRSAAVAAAAAACVAVAVAASSAAAYPDIPEGGKRKRPSDAVGSAFEATAPNALAVFNDYGSPERLFASRRAVVHYVVTGVSAPPLNDDDADGVPDYVERVGDAADTAIEAFERRGFRPIRPDAGGPDGRPDIYVSRFTPGQFGVAYPGAAAAGGAFVAVANNLDPSAQQSLGSVYGTVAHELFHLVQFSYAYGNRGPGLPDWVLEGTAAAVEQTVYPELADIVSSLQLRRWFEAADRSITTQSYGAQLLWRHVEELDARLLPAFLRGIALRGDRVSPVDVLERACARVAGTTLGEVFHRFAVDAGTEHAARIRPITRLGAGDPASGRSTVIAPLAVHYVGLTALGLRRGRSVVVEASRARAVRATLVIGLEPDVPGEATRWRVVRPRLSRDGRRLTFAVPEGLARGATVASRLLVVTSARSRGAARYALAVR